MPPTDPVARALELIEAALGLCEGATPGPWKMDQYRDGRRNQSIESSDVVATEHPGFTVCSLHITAWKTGPRDARPNARFIATARTFGPAALLLAKGLLKDGHPRFCCYLDDGECTCMIGKLAAEFIERMVGDASSSR